MSNFEAIVKDGRPAGLPNTQHYTYPERSKIQNNYTKIKLSDITHLTF